MGFSLKLESQNLFLIENPIRNIFDPNQKIKTTLNIFIPLNLYELNNNPGNLIFSDKKTNLGILYNNLTEKGDFRKPFDEEKLNINKPQIDITYLIDTIQAVHSYISFNENSLTKKYYAENRFPYRGNPYIFADNNPGDVKTDYLTLEAEYSKKIYDDFSFGLLFNYGVGDAVKKEFPKPTSQYRDIGTKAGMSYFLNEVALFGFFVEYFNLYEEISFSDNQRSPRLIKFRGLDYPQIFAGLMGETRLYQCEGYGGGFEFSYSFNDQHSIISTLNFYSNKEKVTDGESFPKTQGRWFEDVLEGKLISNLIFDDLSVRSGLIYELNQQSALRPLINERILDRNNSNFSFFLGSSYKINKELKIFLLYQFYLLERKDEDYINYIKYDIPAISNSIVFGLDCTISEYFNFSLSYNPYIYNPKINKIQTNDPTDTYFTFFEPGIKYYQIRFLEHNFSTHFIYHLGILGDLGFIFNLNFLHTENNKIRDTYNFLTYINLYIF
jgi:hypothetical protein